MNWAAKQGTHPNTANAGGEIQGAASLQCLSHQSSDCCCFISIVAGKGFIMIAYVQSCEKVNAPIEIFDLFNLQILELQQY